MSGSNRILIIDDDFDHVFDLCDFVRDRGGEPVTARNAAEARRRLAAIADGQESYALAIIDVMMPIGSLEDIAKLEHPTGEDSSQIGVTLCREARERYCISPQMLDIVCFSIRNDIVEELMALEVQYISKVSHGGWIKLYAYVEKAIAG